MCADSETHRERRDGEEAGNDAAFQREECVPRFVNWTPFKLNSEPPARAKLVAGFMSSLVLLRPSVHGRNSTGAGAGAAAYPFHLHVRPPTKKKSKVKRTSL